jgi:hypothetical protein
MPRLRGGTTDQIAEEHMNTIAMLRAFCDAVEKHDGAGFASLFTEDGI